MSAKGHQPRKIVLSNIPTSLVSMDLLIALLTPYPGQINCSLWPAGQVFLEYIDHSLAAAARQFLLNEHLICQHQIQVTWSTALPAFEMSRNHHQDFEIVYHEICSLKKQIYYLCDVVGVLTDHFQEKFNTVGYPDVIDVSTQWDADLTHTQMPLHHADSADDTAQWDVDVAHSHGPNHHEEIERSHTKGIDEVDYRVHSPGTYANRMKDAANACVPANGTAHIDSELQSYGLSTNQRKGAPNELSMHHADNDNALHSTGTNATPWTTADISENPPSYD